MMKVMLLFRILPKIIQMIHCKNYLKMLIYREVISKINNK